MDEFDNGNQFPLANSDTYSAVRLVSLATGQISNLLGNGYTANPYASELFGFAADFAFGNNNGSIFGAAGTGYYIPPYGSGGLAFASDQSALIGLPNQVAFSNIVQFGITNLVLDSSGNLYFSSAPLPVESDEVPPISYTVSMMDASGNITTIAGSGSPTYSSGDDGGPAINAGMTPGALAVDAAGDVFIADPVANVVRVVVAPLSTTVANHGNIYLVAGNSATGGSFCGDGMVATSACLNSPGGLKVDAVGNLFISDTLNNRVREVSTVPIPRVGLGHCTTNRAGVTTCTE